jgi:hypothetical protein
MAEIALASSVRGGSLATVNSRISSTTGGGSNIDRPVDPRASSGRRAHGSATLNQRACCSKRPKQAQPGLPAPSCGFPAIRGRSKQKQLARLRHDLTLKRRESNRAASRSLCPTSRSLDGDVGDALVRDRIALEPERHFGFVHLEESSQKGTAAIGPSPPAAACAAAARLSFRSGSGVCLCLLGRDTN